MDVDALAKILGEAVRRFAGTLRLESKEVGKSCAVAECDALTLGVRCSACSRRLCQTHCYWDVRVSPFRSEPICPYCIFARHSEIFADDDHVEESEILDGEVAG